MDELYFAGLFELFWDLKIKIKFRKYKATFIAHWLWGDKDELIMKLELKLFVKIGEERARVFGQVRKKLAALATIALKKSLIE